MIRVSIGVDVDGRKDALWAALAFGILNAALQAIVGSLPVPNTLITLLLLAVIANATLFYVTPAFVKGFRVNGCVHALIASIVLGILSTTLLWVWGSIRV